MFRCLVGDVGDVMLLHTSPNRLIQFLRVFFGIHVMRSDVTFASSMM